MGNRPGFGRVAVAQMPLHSAQADRGCDAVQAEMRDLHITKLSSRPVRQGPSLSGIVGSAGKVEGFHIGRVSEGRLRPGDVGSTPCWQPGGNYSGALVRLKTASPKRRPRRHHRLSQGAELNGKTRSLDGPRVRRGATLDFYARASAVKLTISSSFGFRAELYLRHPPRPSVEMTINFDRKRALFGLRRATAICRRSDDFVRRKITSMTRFCRWCSTWCRVPGGWRVWRWGRWWLRGDRGSGARQ